MTTRPVPIEDPEHPFDDDDPFDGRADGDDLANIPDAARPNLKRPVETAMARPDDDTASPVGLAVLVGLLGLVWITGGFGYVFFILALLFIIFMHELGHYATAKWSGMKVTEFFIGFGPKLWSFRKGETEYGVKGIPAGAYVRIIGMNNLEDVPPHEEHRTYRQKSFPKRMLVICAGSLMHFIMAFLLLYGVIVGHGINRDQTQWGLGGIAPDGAAAAMGLQEGDRILSGDGVEFTTWFDMAEFVQARPNETVSFSVLRDDAVLQVTGTLGEFDEPDRVGEGRLGVGFNQNTLPLEDVGVVEGVGETASEFWGASTATVGALGDFFSPSGLRDLGERVFSPDPDQTDEEAANRPISVVGATKIGAELSDDPVAVALLLASLNIFIGIFNLVPLLPLDGGHASVAIYERIRSRNGRRYMADVSKLLPVAYATLAVLVFVGFATIYLDIADPISL